MNIINEEQHWHKYNDTISSLDKAATIIILNRLKKGSCCAFFCLGFFLHPKLAIQKHFVILPLLHYYLLLIQCFLLENLDIHIETCFEIEKKTKKEKRMQQNKKELGRESYNSLINRLPWDRPFCQFLNIQFSVKLKIFYWARRRKRRREVPFRRTTYITNQILRLKRTIRSFVKFRAKALFGTSVIKINCSEIWTWLYFFGNLICVNIDEKSSSHRLVIWPLLSKTRSNRSNFLMNIIINLFRFLRECSQNSSSINWKIIQFVNKIITQYGWDRWDSEFVPILTQLIFVVDWVWLKSPLKTCTFYTKRTITLTIEIP